MQRTGKEEKKMKKRHLFWIIPLSFIVGLLTYAFLQQHSDSLLFSAFHSCYCELYNLSNNPNCIQYYIN